MPSTNFNRLARVRESTIGVTPASPAMEYCHITGMSLKPAKNFVRSQTITGKRAIKEHLAVGEAVEGGVNFEFAFGYADWLLELANQDSFAAMVEAYNLTPDSNVTDLNSTTQTLLAAGSWKVGLLIETSGFPAAGNNVRFRAAAGTGAGTLVAPAATFASDDTAPAAGVRVVAIGIEGASGDISTTSTGLASASNLFLNMPLLPGMGIKIGGAAAGQQFATAACNAFVPIKSVAADGSAITLDELPAGWAVDNGAGKTIQIFVGDDSRTGDVVLTDTLQAWNTKVSPVFGETLIGCAAQTFGLTLPLNNLVTGQATLIGFAGELVTTLLDAAPTDPLIGGGDVMKTGLNISRITEGGVAIASGLECQGMTWNLNNNITPVGSLDKDRAIDFSIGDALITIEGQYRAGKKDIIEKFYSGIDSRQFFVVYRGDQAYMVRLLSGTYTDYDPPVQGRNGEWISRMRLEAKEDPVTGLLFVVTRFRKWR